MKLSAEIAAFQTRLGHRFADPALLVRALTHASVASPARHDNQRLEFLGDRVLGLIMAEAVVEADPEATEGQLAPRFNALVRKETCAEVARDLGLGDVLKLGRSELMSGGRRKEAVLGDAIEAVIAALYLDAGLGVARDLVLRHWGDRVAGVDERLHNPKSALQELTQAAGLGLPQYRELARSGPDHQPLFTVEVRLENGRAASASAPGKRAAETAAATALLAQLEKNNG